MLPKGRSLAVNEGDVVRKGDLLLDGSPVPHDILNILGIGSSFKTLPIDRAGLGLVLFLIPTAVIGYVHYKK